MACGLVFRGTHEISLTNNPLLYTTVFENHQKCLVFGLQSWYFVIQIELEQAADMT